jgi:hypothetical protein
MKKQRKQKQNKSSSSFPVLASFLLGVCYSTAMNFFKDKDWRACICWVISMAIFAFLLGWARRIAED